MKKFLSDGVKKKKKKNDKKKLFLFSMNWNRAQHLQNELYVAVWRKVIM